LSQAFATRNVTAPKGETWLARHPRSVIVLVILMAAFVLGQFIPAFQTYPEGAFLTTGAFWDNGVRYLNVNHYDTFEAVKIFFLSNG